MTSYILYYAILQKQHKQPTAITAHRLNLRWSKSVDWTRPRRWKVPQTISGTGRRTIGQLAEHEIHLEIEDVLDKKRHNKGNKLTFINF